MSYEVLKGLVIIGEFSLVLLAAAILIMIMEKRDAKREKEANRIMKHRKKAFAAEVERAGQKMMNEDKAQKVVTENGKKQKIKYTGLFSGAIIEAMMP